eukprot:893739-Karenia_brevis.AAC.1
MTIGSAELLGIHGVIRSCIDLVAQGDVVDSIFVCYDSTFGSKGTCGEFCLKDTAHAHVVHAIQENISELLQLCPV